jgi:hypothetical protein
MLPQVVGTIVQQRAGRAGWECVPEGRSQALRLRRVESPGSERVSAAANERRAREDGDTMRYARRHA